MTKKRGKGQKVNIQRVRLRGEASEEAALRIEELARGLRSGVIHLANGDVAIEAPAGSDLTWEIEARSGRRKSRIEIEIRWRAPESRQEDDDEEDDDEVDADAEGVSEVEAGEVPSASGETPGPQPGEPQPPEQELENPTW